MKRLVVVMTVWAMALAGVLAGVVFPSSASAAPTLAAVTAASGSYTSVATARVFDGKVTTAQQTVIIAGKGGVPAGATAVMLNTEVFAPTAAGYVRVTPFGQNAGVATQEFMKGQAISNLVAVKLVGGQVQVKVSAGSARILMDVSGYYSDTAGSKFSALPTARVFDATVGTAQRAVQIAGKGGVPASATSVMLNTEVFAPSKAGYVRVTPLGLDAGVATQQFVKGQAISNLVSVKLVNGMAQVKVSAGSARILMDVAGYYSAVPAEDAFTPLPTARVFDGKTATTQVQVQIAGKGGVPANATAVMVNTEVFAPTAAGYVRVTPATKDAGVATQQFVKGQAVSNLVAVKLVGGQVQVKVSAGSARILMDVAGYYTAADVTPPVVPPVVTPPTPKDVTAPGPVTNLNAQTDSATSITLTWANPTAADFTGVTIRRQVGAVAPASAITGTAVIVAASTTATTLTDAALTADTQYSYAVFAHDGVPNYAVAATVTSKTATPPLGIATTSMTAGTAGLSYLQPLTATGGKAPYLWAATGLPAGLTVSPEGIISGTPTTTGTTSIGVQVTDGAGTTLTRTLSLAVPDTLPAPCLTGACSILTPGPSTVALAAAGVVSMSRDAATGAVNQIVINSAAPAAGQILAVEPTPAAPSGLTAAVNTVTDNGDGTTTLAVTPGKPGDAFTSGTVKADGSATMTATTLPAAGATPTGKAGPLVTTAQAKTSPGRAQALSPAALAALKMSCDGEVTSNLKGLSVDPGLSPKMALDWNAIQGVKLFQADLDGTITVNLGVNISGAATCTLELPAVVATVPAGPVGVVLLKVAPSLTFEVTGQIDLRASVTLTCGVQYKWEPGQTSNPAYCHATNKPMQITAATGIDATLTGAIEASVTLNDIIGVTGSISAAAHAGYHPTTSPVVQIDASVTVELGGCIVCFIDDGLVKFTLYQGTLFEKVLYTSDTPPTQPPSVATTTLPDAVIDQPYTAALSATGGTAPYTWAVTSGSPPPGLSLSAAGSITGTATTGGPASFTVTATDAAGSTATASLTLTVKSLEVYGLVVDPGPPVKLIWMAVASATGYQVLRCDGDCTPTTVLGSTTSPGYTDATALPLHPYTYAVRATNAAGPGPATQVGVTTTSGVDLLAWGDNFNGELGDDTFTDRSVPVAVTTSGALAGTMVTDIAAGGSNTCAIASGQVYCWGTNQWGGLGLDPRKWYSDVPVAVSTAGVLAGKTVTALTVGYDQACVVASGQLYCWGGNYSGQLGDGTTENRFVPVAVSTAGVLAGKTVTAMSAGTGSTCVVASGQVYCWGRNDHGQLGDGTTTNRSVPVAVSSTGVLVGKKVTAVSVGDGHTCAVASEQVYCWGVNQNAEMGDGTTTERLVPVAVSNTGVLAGKSVTAVSVDYFHTCVVASAQAYCWGSNMSGELGDGVTTNTLVPVTVSTAGVLAGKTVTAIAAGIGYTCAVASGQVYCWGSNAEGALGDGATVTYSGVPVAVSTAGVLAGKTVTALSVGTFSAVVLAH
jgi:alpha-tubulin suppressor-like RCC1 family protein